MDTIHEAIQQFANSVVNIVDEHVYIVFSVNNNVNNNVNSNLNNNVDRNFFVYNNVDREDLAVMQTLLDDWAREALKDLQQLFEANDE